MPSAEKRATGLWEYDEAFPPSCIINGNSFAFDEVMELINWTLGGEVLTWSSLSERGSLRDLALDVFFRFRDVAEKLQDEKYRKQKTESVRARKRAEADSVNLLRSQLRPGFPFSNCKPLSDVAVAGGAAPATYRRKVPVFKIFGETFDVFELLKFHPPNVHGRANFGEALPTDWNFIGRSRRDAWHKHALQVTDYICVNSYCQIFMIVSACLPSPSSKRSEIAHQSRHAKRKC
jgi:hypothetical protein